MHTGFVDAGNITKIYRHQGKFYCSIYTLYQGKEVLVCPSLESSAIALEQYPAIRDLITDKVSFCFRKSMKSGFLRVYFEEAMIQDGRFIHKELFSCKNEDFLEALNEMNCIVESFMERRKI